MTRRAETAEGARRAGMRLPLTAGELARYQAAARADGLPLTKWLRGLAEKRIGAQRGAGR